MTYGQTEKDWPAGSSTSRRSPAGGASTHTTVDAPRRDGPTSRYARGQLVFADLKTETGQLTRDQEQWLKELREVPALRSTRGGRLRGPRFSRCCDEDGTVSRRDRRVRLLG